LHSPLKANHTESPCHGWPLNFATKTSRTPQHIDMSP
jgi:hypothetical protein